MFQLSQNDKTERNPPKQSRPLPIRSSKIHYPRDKKGPGLLSLSKTKQNKRKKTSTVVVDR